VLGLGVGGLEVVEINWLLVCSVVNVGIEVPRHDDVPLYSALSYGVAEFKVPGFN
jgi:hypothetical protein